MKMPIVYMCFSCYISSIVAAYDDGDLVCPICGASAFRYEDELDSNAEHILGPDEDDED